MNYKRSMKTEVSWYLAVTFSITYGIGAIGFWKGGLAHFPVATLSMLIPALVTIALYLLWKKPIFKGNDLGIKLANWKYWLLVPASMFLLVAITYLLSYAVSPAILLDYDDILVNLTKASINSGGNPFLNLALVLGLNIFIAPLINFPVFLGEELGWRGFLTPRLLKFIRPAPAFILSGGLWGLWHLFGIVMGHNYPGYPITGIFMMVLVCIPLGVIFQYYYIKSGSIFIPMIAHGAVNWTATTFMVFFIDPKAFEALYHGPAGMTGILVFWIAGFYYYKRFNTLMKSRKHENQ